MSLGTLYGFGCMHAWLGSEKEENNVVEHILMFSPS